MKSNEGAPRRLSPNLIAGIGIASLFSLAIYTGSSPFTRRPVTRRPAKTQAPLASRAGAPEQKPVSPLEETGEQRRHSIWNDWAMEETSLDSRLDQEFGRISLHPGDTNAQIAARDRKRNDRNEAMRAAYEPAFFSRWHIKDADMIQIRSEGRNKHWRSHT